MWEPQAWYCVPLRSSHTRRGTSFLVSPKPVWCNPQLPAEQDGKVIKSASNVSLINRFHFPLHFEVIALGVWMGRNVCPLLCFQYQSGIKISMSSYCQGHITQTCEYRSIRDVTLTSKIKYLDRCVMGSTCKVLMPLWLLEERFLNAPRPARRFRVNGVLRRDLLDAAFRSPLGVAL